MTPTNEAGHGLPELPESVWLSDVPVGTPLYTAAQVQQYAIDYAAALALSRGVPDGWKLVPVEPTDEMVDAGRVAVMALDCCGPKWTVRKHYEASGADPAGIPDELLDAICPMPKADRAELVYRAMLAAAPAAAGAQGEEPQWVASLRAEVFNSAMKDVFSLSRDEVAHLLGGLLSCAPPATAAPQPAAADGGVRERATELEQAQRLADLVVSLRDRAKWGRGGLFTSPHDSEGTSRLLDMAADALAALSSHRQAGDVTQQVHIYSTLNEVQRNSLDGLLANIEYEAGDVDDSAPSIDADEDAYWAYHQWHAINILRGGEHPVSAPPGPDLSKSVASVCLVTERRLPHFASVEVQLYDGYEPKIGDRLALVEKGAGS